jgi:hypothetical protein
MCIYYNFGGTTTYCVQQTHIAASYSWYIIGFNVRSPLLQIKKPFDTMFSTSFSFLHVIESIKIGVTVKHLGEHPTKRRLGLGVFRRRGQIGHDR